METRVFCVELKMGPSGHMDSTGIFPDSNTREFGPRRTTQRQPPRPTHKCNAPRLPFHVHLTHDLTRAASALPLHTAALAFVSFGIVLVQVQVQVLGWHDLTTTGISHHLATSLHWWPVVCNYNCRQANLHDVPASKPTLADMISQPLATSLHWWQDLQLKRPQLTWFSQ